MSTIAIPRMPATPVQPRAPATALGFEAARPRRAPLLQRLASWAERQPMHRRVGAWTLPWAVAARDSFGA